MSALSKTASLPRAGGAVPIVDQLILARIASKGGATRAQLIRDLAPAFSMKPAATNWRTTIDAALARLMIGGQVQEAKMRLCLGAPGEAALAHFLGEKATQARDWSELRDIWLVAKALKLDAGKPAIRSALSRQEGLSALVVQSTFGLAVRQALSPSKLRAALALVAIERAFGDNVKEGLGKKGSALSAKAGRVLAGQLLRKPRELPSDGRLITALALDELDMARFDTETARLALLRRLVSTPVADAPAKPASRAPRVAPAPVATARAEPILAPQAQPTVQVPGLAQFSAGVIDAARTRAEGWPGARKAFISQVWEAIRTSHPEWGLSEIEFKDMLAGAHRAGQLVLAGADLKNKQNIKEFEDSAILYKNTVWHYVRVED